MIVEIHESLEGYGRKDDPLTGKRSDKFDIAYFRQPAVWKDIKTAFTTFFAECPDRDSVSWHHNFAKHAWLAQDWVTLNEQLPLLGKVNYTYFGGRQQFDQVVADAKAHAAP